MFFLLGCLINADQQRCAIRAGAISAGQRGLEDGQAALGARQQRRQEEWGAQGLGCTQQAQGGPGGFGSPGTSLSGWGVNLCQAQQEKGRRPGQLTVSWVSCSYAMHAADGERKAQTCSPPSGTRPVSGGGGRHGIRGGDDPVFPGPACIPMLLHF